MTTNVDPKQAALDLIASLAAHGNGYHFIAEALRRATLPYANPGSVAKVAKRAGIKIEYRPGVAA